MGVDASQSYLDAVAAFDDVVRGCTDLSIRCSGIPSPSNQHFHASVLFTVLCVRGTSLGFLAPHGSLSTRSIEHWDYASTAVMTRSLLEVRIAFYYLCIERCSGQEWGCRWNLFNLHDCVTAIRLSHEMGLNASDSLATEEMADELRERLAKNKFFVALSEKERKKYLKGGSAYLYPLEDIAHNAGVDRSTFRWLYRFLSIHVHAFPMSIYGLRRFDRGTGVHTEVEEGYTLMLLQFATGLLDTSRGDMERLFRRQLRAPRGARGRIRRRRR